MVEPLNKRRYPRLPITALCDVSLTGKELMPARGCVVNCSLGGIALVTNVKYETKTKINVVLHIGRDHPVLNGEIVYSREIMKDLYLYGIRFVGLSFIRKVALNFNIHNWVKMSQEKEKTDTTNPENHEI